MPDRWTRWRRFMDGWEEAAREAGAQLEEVESLLAEAHQRPDWRRPQEDAVAGEMVRRARSIPALGPLVDAAARLGRDLPPPPDVSFRREPGGRTPAGAGEPPLPGPAPPPPGDPPPPRLRAAERALRHRTRSLAVGLEALCHPHNISAVLRTAEVMGLQEVHVIEPAGRPPLVDSITQSAHRYLDIHWHRDTASGLAAMRRRGYRILAADHAPGSAPLDRVETGPQVAVVLGSEQTGVSSTLREEADGLFHIPAAGFCSYLNVSTAAAIALYEIDRRMRLAGHRAPLPEWEQQRLRESWYRRLARGRPDRLAAYRRWLAAPPPPAPDHRPVPSREKARTRDDGSGG